MSLAKVSGGDFSRAFLNQVELGRSQPSTRVLRVIAGRLGTEVDFLLEGRLPAMERELALEKARVLVARGHPRRALAALATVVESFEWPLGTDARLCQAEACQSVGSEAVAERVKARLGVAWHGTTADGKVTLEPVYCLGLCATAPSAVLDGRVVGRLDETRIDALVAEAQR